MQTLIVSNTLNTSAFIIESSVTPLIIIAYFNAGRSIQPQRLGRPVVDPNSFPSLRIVSPSSSNNSVGKGPLPTRVQYALNIPITEPMVVGATPKPVHVPAVTVFEDVTNGYVPKSISSIVPCAPSANIFLPAFNSLFKNCSLSIHVNERSNSIPSKKGPSNSGRLYSNPS